MLPSRPEQLDFSALFSFSSMFNCSLSKTNCESDESWLVDSLFWAAAALPLLDLDFLLAPNVATLISGTLLTCFSLRSDSHSCFSFWLTKSRLLICSCSSSIIEVFCSESLSAMSLSEWLNSITCSSIEHILASFSFRSCLRMLFSAADWSSLTLSSSFSSSKSWRCFNRPSNIFFSVNTFWWRKRSSFNSNSRLSLFSWTVSRLKIWSSKSLFSAFRATTEASSEVILESLVSSTAAEGTSDVEMIELAWDERSSWVKRFSSLFLLFDIFFPRCNIFILFSSICCLSSNVLSTFSFVSFSLDPFGPISAPFVVLDSSIMLLYDLSKMVET